MPDSKSIFCLSIVWYFYKPAFSLNSSQRISFLSRRTMISLILSEVSCNFSNSFDPLLSFTSSNFFSFSSSAISFSKFSNSVFSLKENFFEVSRLIVQSVLLFFSSLPFAFCKLLRCILWFIFFQLLPKPVLRIVSGKIFYLAVPFKSKKMIYQAIHKITVVTYN